MDKSIANTNELDVFQIIELDEVQQHNLQAIRHKIKPPRAIWLDGKRGKCLAVAVGNGHYVAKVVHPMLPMAGRGAASNTTQFA